MPSLRRAAARLCAATLASDRLASLARARRGRALVLNYHVMRAQEMREHLDLLLDLFDVVPLEVALRRAAEGPPVGRAPAALTFDDGKRSHLTEVVPVLRERGVHATFFVTSQPSATGTIHWFDWAHRMRLAFDEGLRSGDDVAVSLALEHEELVLRRPGRPTRVDFDALKRMDSARRLAVVAALAERLGVDPAPQDDDERALTPDEVAEVARQGFEVGSHSATHPILTLETRERIWHEVADSQSLISEWIGHPVTHFCYPNGNASDATEAATRKAGYEAAWTTVPLWLGANENLHRLPRVQIFAEYDRGEIALKSALATVGALPNPDGTGRAYRNAGARGAFGAASPGS